MDTLLLSDMIPNIIKCMICKNESHFVTEIQKKDNLNKIIKSCPRCISIEDDDIVWINSVSETRDENGKTAYFFQLWPKAKGCVERMK